MGVALVNRNTDGENPRDALRQAIAELQKARDTVAERDAALGPARQHLRNIDVKIASTDRDQGGARRRG